MDFGVSEEENAGHAFDVACGEADEVAVEPGYEHAGEAFAIEILTEFGAREAESLIKLGLRIAEAGDVRKFVVSEKRLGFFFGAQVDEGELRAAGFDFLAPRGEVRDHLAAKGTAEMAEKRDELRTLGGQRG